LADGAALGQRAVPSKHLAAVPGPKYENANPGAQAPRRSNFLPEVNDIPKPLVSFADQSGPPTAAARRTPR